MTNNTHHALDEENIGDELAPNGQAMRMPSQPDAYTEQIINRIQQVFNSATPTSQFKTMDARILENQRLMIDILANIEQVLEDILIEARKLTN